MPPHLNITRSQSMIPPNYVRRLFCAKVNAPLPSTSVSGAAGPSRPISQLISEQKGLFKSPEFIFSPEAASTPLRPSTSQKQNNLQDSTNFAPRPSTPTSSPDNSGSAAYIHRSNSFPMHNRSTDFDFDNT
ncbi:hypothetical protein C8R44DRAFT_737128 [Mycena epipterygia]|nr:hypothetical protein C8R44DRAFT_737128 [Mycena epipterygia]